MVSYIQLRLFDQYWTLVTGNDHLRKTSIKGYLAVKGTLELVLSSFRFQPRRNKQEAPLFFESNRIFFKY